MLDYCYLPYVYVVDDQSLKVVEEKCDALISSGLVRLLLFVQRGGRRAGGVLCALLDFSMLALAIDAK